MPSAVRLSEVCEGARSPGSPSGRGMLASRARSMAVPRAACKVVWLRQPCWARRQGTSIFTVGSARGAASRARLRAACFPRKPYHSAYSSLVVMIVGRRWCRSIADLHESRCCPALLGKFRTLRSDRRGTTRATYHPWWARSGASCCILDTLARLACRPVSCGRQRGRQVHLAATMRMVSGDSVNSPKRQTLLLTPWPRRERGRQMESRTRLGGASRTQRCR